MSNTALADAIASLHSLQRAIVHHSTAVCEQPWQPGESPSLGFFVVGDGLQLQFFGESWEDDPSEPADATDENQNFAWCALLDWLAQPHHAATVRALQLAGPDRGANGIREWHFGRLLQSEVVFPRLEQLDIQWTDPAHHNLGLVVGMAPEDGLFMREGGTLAQLLRHMPRLVSLRTPSAPDASFFEGAPHPLQHLCVQSGTGHQQFIANLARSPRFAQLRTLDYSEVCAQDGADPEELAQQYTALHDFEALLDSPQVQQGRLGHFKLRGTRLSAPQLIALQARAPHLQWLYVAQQAASYVSHWPAGQPA